MDSHPTGFLNHSTDLLEVTCNIGTIYIKGKPYHPVVETLQLHRQQGEWVDAHLICRSLSPDVVIERISVFSPTENKLILWDGTTPSFPCFYEQQNYEFLLIKSDDDMQLPVTFHHDSLALREAVTPKGKQVLSGLLNFKNEVGFTELELRSSGQRLLSIELEIFPSKLDYKQDYIQLLREVNEQVYNLSFDFLKRTYQSVRIRDTEHQSLSEFFALITHLFHQMETAMERINRQPHHKLDQLLERRPAARVKRGSNRNNAYLARHPQYVEQDAVHGWLPIGAERYQPTHLLDTVKHISYDTAENRFLRWMLERILSKLQQLRDQYTQLTRPQNFRSRAYDSVFVKRVDQMISRLEQLLSLEWLQAISPMRQMSSSLVLQMAPGYREMYRYYLLLLKGLSIQSDLLRLSMKDIAEIYEYWCFLKLNELLSRKYPLIKQNLIRFNHSGLFVTLGRGQQSRMEYLNPRNNETFVLYYNRLPSKELTPTLPQRPDNVLSLMKVDAGQKKEYSFIFDAKYKLNAAVEGSPYASAYLKPGPQEEDINTMHRYRDAIVHASTAEKYERSMFGAYVLFPYGDEEQFREHHFYRSIRKLNVGAFPFLPNATRLVEQFLDELIQDSPEKAYERASSPRGTQAYYQDKLVDKNMLIGSVRGPEQIEIALAHHFYHVPLANFIDTQVITQIEYVAMCESRRKFEALGRTGISYYGKVDRWDIVKRSDITEIPAEPQKADLLYVKFTVTEWQERTEPIVLAGQGIYTLLYTSKYMFDRAQELAELRLESEADLAKWREKRRVGKVKVKLDNTYVDLAKRVIDVGIEEE